MIVFGFRMISYSFCMVECDFHMILYGCHYYDYHYSYYSSCYYHYDLYLLLFSTENKINQQKSFIKIFCDAIALRPSPHKGHKVFAEELLYTSLCAA